MSVTSVGEAGEPLTTARRKMRPLLDCTSPEKVIASEASGSATLKEVTKGSVTQPPGLISFGVCDWRATTRCEV